MTATYPGAKWWRFDFHTYTRASTDFLEGCDEKTKAEVTPEFWLQKFIDKSIDCVAVTDHNSGAWVGELQDALKKLEDQAGKKLLWLFPGVEISVNGGIHILAIFDTDKTTAHIDSLLGAVGYRGTRGDSDGVTSKSAVEVIDIIHQLGGLAIPAHVDKEKGLFETYSGQSLQTILKSQHLHAIELCDPDYSKPAPYVKGKFDLTEVCGSDMHNFRSEKFGTFTWVKMDTPSLAGLKLALIDGQASVNRDMQAQPNQHASYIIEKLEVSNAKYLGQTQTLQVSFSPFLSTLIGGRGSGKSTLLEFMRLALRRDKELQPELKGDNAKYYQLGDDSLLTENSLIRLVYRKGDTRYRLKWDAKSDINSLEVQGGGGEWESEVGEIESLFPAKIFSQKQIFALAQDPQALLEIIDKSPEVDYAHWQAETLSLKNQYKQKQSQINELVGKCAQKNKLQGECNNLRRQIAEIEKSGHKDILQIYRIRQAQVNAIKTTESTWQEMLDSLQAIAQDIEPAEIPEQIFAVHRDIYTDLQSANQQWQAIATQLLTITQQAQYNIDKWDMRKDKAEWQVLLKADIARYQQVKADLQQQGIDPDKYPQLLRQLERVQSELNKISELDTKIEHLKQERDDLYQKIQQQRHLLSEKRTSFLSATLANNEYISIELECFAAGAAQVEHDLRQILQCPDRFENDFSGLMEKLGHDARALKKHIYDIRRGEEEPKDKRFAKHLDNLPQESMVDLKLWFPEDNLRITFGKRNTPLREGSPGQKCAALLAFLLSYGDEPLVLDQPEDDLDNALIYDLIVQQIRASKYRRQIIIVTHNANIVVNGDAEMVLPLSVGGGQSHIKEPASIQDTQVREKICAILEGGQQAFSQRYRRIHIERS